MRIRTVATAAVILAAMTLPVSIPASATVTASAPAVSTGAPGPVTNLTSTPTADGTVVLDWDAPVGGRKATSYLIRLTYVRPDKTFTIGGTSTDTTFTIGLPGMKFVTADTTLTATVRAVNARGRSTPVRVRVVTPTG